MTSAQIDRLTGLSAAVAMKAPVYAATTANITLSGLQTIDGVSVTADKRVLVKNQTTGSQNGIYIASTGAWTRAPDWSSNGEVIEGTQVIVTDGSVSAGFIYRVTTADDIVIGTTSVAFSATNFLAGISSWDAVAIQGTNIASAANINLDTATGPILNLTGTVAITSITLAEGHLRFIRATAASSFTASATLIVNGSAVTGQTNAANDQLIMVGGAAGVVYVAKLGAATATFATTAALIADKTGSPVNLAIVPSVAASALTIALKGIDGNDPSASNPVYIPFRNVTPGTGTPSVIAIVAAMSLVISSGSTMGFANGVAGRIWVVAFNDAGTVRIGAINCRSGTDAAGYTIYPLTNFGIASSTAEGGAGAADSAQVFYTGTAVTSKAFTVLGYVDLTEATAGTWATAQSLTQVFGPGVKLPGDTMQPRISQDGVTASTTTVLPVDNTIPQSGEGAEFMTLAVTPVASANLLRVRHNGVYSSSGTSGFGCALFRDAAADAISSAVGGFNAANQTQTLSIDKTLLAAAVTSTTFRIRAGGSAGTFRFNAFGAAQVFGGVAGSMLSVEEIVA